MQLDGIATVIRARLGGADREERGRRAPLDQVLVANVEGVPVPKTVLHSDLSPTAETYPAAHAPRPQPQSVGVDRSD